MSRSLRWNGLYPLGFLGIGFVDTLFTQWIVYLHAPPGSSDSSSASAIGTVLLISFLMQGLLNPALGHFSDRLHHKLGPRLPLIQLASLPMALVFYCLWQITAFWPSLGLICLYGLLFVTVVQPYMTLLPMVAPDQAVRVKYSLIGGILSLTATGLALIAGPHLVKTGAFGIFGLLGGLALILTVFLPSLLIREGPVAEPETPAEGSLLMQLRELWQQPQLRSFVTGNACLILTIIALTILSPFLCETVLRQDRAYTSVINLCAFIGVLAAVGFVALRGKQLSFLALMRNLAIADGLLLLVYALLSFYVAIPLLLWQLCFVLLGCLIFVGMMAPNLILAELSDADPKRRRGAIFGLNGLAANLANAFSAKTTALLLAQGKTAAAPQGVQMGMVFAASAALLAGLALHSALRHQPAHAEQVQKT